MADDEDVIYVDVVARLDEGSADDVERTLKDKLKDATSGISDGFKDAAHKIEDEFSSIGDKFRDMFSHGLPKELDSATEKIGDDVGDKISSSIGDKLKSALDKASIGDRLNSSLQNALGDPENFADKISSAFDKLESSLDKLKQIGGSAGNVLTGNSDNPLQDVSDVLGGAKDFGIKLPGPLGNVGKLNDLVNNLNQNPGQSEDWLTENFGFALNPLQDLLTRGPQELGQSIHDAFVPRENVNPIDRTLENSYVKTNPLSAFTDGGTLGNAGSMSSVETQSMSVDAGTVILSGNVSGLTGGGSSGSSGSGLLGSALASGGGSSGSVSGDAYSALGSFSQGGDVTGPGPTGVDSVLAMLAPGEGVLTTSQNQLWHKLMSGGIPHFAGGTGGGDTAAPAAPEGGGGGDEAYDAIGQPGESDSTPGTGDSGGAPGTVGGTEAPGAVQAPDDQAYDAIGQPGQDVTDPTQQGIVGGTKTSKGIQEQSYGYGKGFQVTGQGLIGFAESAPGAIASAAASGASGGPAPAGIAAGAGAAALTSLWNTIGEPELNEAITQGVKIGADLASAPNQELAVGGENFQNWSQKLIGGEIGNVTNLINTAANTAAPLTQQDNGNQQNLAGQAAGGNGTLGGQPSPAGTQGDPMHVSIVGGPSGGSQNDAMSSVGMDSSGTA